MMQSQRWNTLQICRRRDSNTGGSDLCCNRLPLDHGGTSLRARTHTHNDIMMFTECPTLSTYSSSLTNQQQNWPRKKLLKNAPRWVPLGVTEPDSITRDVCKISKIHGIGGRGKNINGDPKNSPSPRESTRYSQCVAANIDLSQTQREREEKWPESHQLVGTHSHELP